MATVSLHGRAVLSIPASAAARLLLEAQRLADDPGRRAGPGALQALVERMGFVQIDTINVIERAHHLTLFSRLHGYQPRMLADLLERRRSLWEHWTHDASAIPTQWFPFWRHRFERYRRRVRRHAWWAARLGVDPDRTIAQVKDRIAREGPALSRDFEHDRAGATLPEDGWWGWKPAKAALEHLWRSGELAIVRRENFQKVYDLTERVLAAHHALPAPSSDEHAAWACRSALERLVIATPSEIAAFWNAIDIAAARQWCRHALGSGELIEVEVASLDGTAARKSLALASDEARLRRAARPRNRTQGDADAADNAPIRALSPFDPILRDRQRALRLFGFDYRFEAFVPAPHRKFGYYVLPLLQGERLVGRIDPKFHRDRGELVVRRVWWEPKVRATRARRAALNEALQRLGRFIGAERVMIERGR